MRVFNVPTQPIHTNFAPNTRLATLHLPSQDTFTRSPRFAGQALLKEPERQDGNPLADVFTRYRDVEALSFLTEKNIRTLKEIKNRISNFPSALQPEIFEGWLQVADALRHVENSQECVDMSMNLLNKLLEMKKSELKSKNIQKPDSNNAKTLSRIYKSLAKIHQRRDDIEMALELMEEAISVERSPHNLFYYGTILHYNAREFKMAKPVYNEALALAEKQRNTEYVSRCCLCLGDLATDAGNGIDAIHYYQRAVRAATGMKLRLKTSSALRRAQAKQSVRR